MNIDTNRHLAYVFKESEDGIVMNDNNGFAYELEDIEELCKGLMKFAKKHNKEIKAYNAQHKIEFEADLHGWYRNCEAHDKKERSERKKNMKRGYVYLLECGGRYKVGYSKDVKKRVKQLDTRPFKLNVVAVSQYLDNAYDWEQELHQVLDLYRIDGEWYELDGETLSFVINDIKNLENDM